MANLRHFEFKQVSWQIAAADIMELRKKVFVIEQRFDREVMCDAFDDNCFHILVNDETGLFVGSGRVTQDGRIGKIVVLINHRGVGIGTNILNQLINIAAQNGIKNLTLNAEKELVEFYDQQKFHTDGPVYMKQGVPYQRMAKKLA